MSSDWVTTTWGDVATLEYGKALDAPQEDGPIPVFGTNGPTGARCARPLSGKPGVIVGRKGAYRGIHWSAEPFWVIDTAFYLEPDPDHVYPKWAYYELLTRDINAMDSGSAIPSTSRPDFYAMSLLVPPLDEQRRIAGVLGALDDKIEHDFHLAASLEQLAALQFRHLFPMIEGGDALGDHVAIAKGKSYKSEELTDSSTALVTLKSIRRGGGYAPGGLKPFVGDYKTDQVVGAGEIVVAQTDLTQAADVIGKPAIVPGRTPYDTLVASLDLAIVRPQTDCVSRLFLYHLLISEPFQQHAYAYSNGSTVLHLSKDAIPSFAFEPPSPERLAEFDSLADPLFAQAVALGGAAETLEAIREALLPRLVSGALRVPDSYDPVDALGTVADAAGVAVR